MDEGSGALVALILAPLFVAVGIYLIWYSRRRKKMLAAFAKTHQLMLRPEYKEEIQKTLDSCFSINNGSVVRSFGQLSSLVFGESIWFFRTVELLDLNPHAIWFFRTVELLDLNPHAQSYSTHFSRIAVLFNILTDHDEFFLLDKSRHASRRLPGSKLPDPHIADLVKRSAMSCKARHPISVTLTGGYGLIYFEPLVTGGETISDINSLYCIAKNIREKLSEDA
jgi:hypothetical protein